MLRLRQLLTSLHGAGGSISRVGAVSPSCSVAIIAANPSSLVRRRAEAGRQEAAAVVGSRGRYGRHGSVLLEIGQPIYRLERHQDHARVPVVGGCLRLWRWATILNEFAYWEGNTIGLASAWIGENVATHGWLQVWPNERIQPIACDTRTDAGDLRLGLRLAVHDIDNFQRSMPALLTHFSVPLDVVILLTEKGSTSSHFVRTEATG